MAWTTQRAPVEGGGGGDSALQSHSLNPKVNNLKSLLEVSKTDQIHQAPSSQE